MSNITLYEITAQYREAFDALAESPDLPAEVIADTLEGIAGELEEKSINVAKYLRNIEATADAIKAAEAEMKQRRERLQKRVAWLKNYLLTNMERAEISKISSPWFQLSIRQNPPAVDIFDRNLLPESMLTTKTETVVNKKAIAEKLKQGHHVPGARFVESTRLQIK